MSAFESGLWSPDGGWLPAILRENCSSQITRAPDLAIEVVSPGNSAQDMLARVHQYLAAGAQAVWVFYPNLKLVEVHDAHGIREIAAPASLEEERLFPGLRFVLPLTEVFDEDRMK